MSEKEFAIKLLNDLPAYKLGYAIAYLQGLAADETADDEYCASLVRKYEDGSDKDEFVPFDDALKMCGVDINAIQN